MFEVLLQQNPAQKIRTNTCNCEQLNKDVYVFGNFVWFVGHINADALCTLLDVH